TNGRVLLKHDLGPKTADQQRRPKEQRDVRLEFLYKSLGGLRFVGGRIVKADDADRCSAPRNIGWQVAAIEGQRFREINAPPHRNRVPRFFVRHPEPSSSVATFPPQLVRCEI